MKEIKFKAVIDNKIYEVVEIGFNADGITDISVIDKLNGDWIDKVEKYPIGIVKLIQYTGLKDKNGQEIYEGDIVKGQACKDINPPKEKIYIVKENEETSGFYPFTFVEDQCRYDGCGGCYRMHSNMCEVVGNIYENPELLEEK